MDNLPNTAKCSPKVRQSTRQVRLQSVLMITLLSFPTISLAYVGPGAGITMLGALWAVILAVLFVLGGILIWPIRSLLRRRKGGADADSSGGENAEDSASVRRESHD